MSAGVLAGRIVFFIVLCSCLSLSGMAQLGTGSITGTAQDTSGAVVPGVSIILSNPGTIGGNQHTITDERGVFQFIRLVPGSYSVRAELGGFRAAVRENVLVNADAAARVDLRLEVGDITDTITVTGEAPLLDTTSTFNQTIFDRQILDTLPNGKDLWSIGRIAPAVVMNSYDVGGSESFRQATATVHGSLQAENKYLIDGMDVSDLAGAGSFLLAYFDPFMFQEVNVQTGNGPAEKSRGGVVYNLVTRTGTNDFHGSFQFAGSNHGLQSNNVSQELRSHLLAAVPARVLAANPGLDPDPRIFGMFDSGLSVSGPIVRNKLWFTTSGGMESMNAPRLGSYNADGTPVVDDGRMKNFSFKISWQSSPGSQLHFSWNRNIKDNFHRTIIANIDFFENRATWVQRNEAKIWQLKWTATVSPRLVLDISSSLMKGSTGLAPQREVQPGDVPRFDAVTLTHSVAVERYNYQPSYRGAFNANLSYVIGTHDLKVGFQSDRANQKSEEWSVSHYPSGLLAIYRNGAPDSVNTYNTPVNFRGIDFENAVFFQDKWTPTRKLTLNFGLRLEKVNGRVPATCQPQTIFIDAQCFPEIRDVPDFLAPAPRFGLIYDMFGNGKTALKLSANRYHIGTGLGFPFRVNPIRLTNDTRPWTDRNNDFIPQLDELGLSTGFNLGTTNRYSPDVKWPHSNELSAEIEHQLFGDLVVSLGYHHRETRRNIGSRNVAVPQESYIPLQVTERVSGRQVTVYDQSSLLRGRFDVVFDNFSELDSQFNGLDITFNKRFSKRWMAMGGLSLGRNHGDIYGTSDLNNPNFNFRRGLVGNDVPVSFKTSGIYELPYGVRLSANAQHFTGFPENTTVSVRSDTVRLTQVSQSLLVEPRGTTRLPNVNIFDLSARKTFRFGERTSAETIMDIFNLTNSNAIQSRTTQLGPAYGRASNMLRGRLWRFGLSVNF